MYQLKEIFIEMGIRNDFNEATELQELGLDSLQVMELVVRIEEKWDISIDDDDLIGENFETIGTVLRMIENYL